MTTAVKTPDQNLYGVLFGLALLCRLAALIGLGIVAIVAGLQPRPSAEASVQVFPPADPDLRAHPTS